MIELTTLLPKNPGEEKVQALLNADLNGESVEDASEDDETPAPAKAEKKPAAPVAKAAKADTNETPAKPKKPAVKDEDAEEANAEATTDVDAMLAAIRARRNTK
jgi:hypothetical protein